MSVKGTQKGMMIGLKNATEKNASPYALYGIDGDTFIEASDDGLAVGVLNPMYEWEERLHPGEGKPELGICPEDVYGGIQINGIVDVTAEAEILGENIEEDVASAGTFADLAAGDNPVFIFGIAMEASHATVDGSVISVLVMKFVVPASAAVTT